MSVLRSFVSQLRPGDDMTKMSMPSELCHPFSVLELISLRELSYFSVLFGVNKVEDPESRFLAVLKWLVTLLQAEVMEKKPFNPVIGEQHICWVENTKDDWTEFVGEQVSHHPPISSFFARYGTFFRLNCFWDRFFSVGVSSDLVLMGVAKEDFVGWNQ